MARIGNWLTAVCDHPDSPPPGYRSALLGLALKLDWTTGEGFASIADAAAKAGCGTATVKRATAWAAERGLLARTHRGRHVGRGQHSRASEWQTLVPPQPVILGPPQDAAGDHGEPLREFAGDQPGFARDQPGFARDHGEPPSKSSTSKSSPSTRPREPAPADPRAELARLGADKRETDFILDKIKNDPGIRRPAAYLRAALSNGDGAALIEDARRELAADAGTPMPDGWPPWCGHCDLNRHREDDEGRLYRCPDCHPLAVKGEP
jgi:hypothetical protein